MQPETSHVLLCSCPTTNPCPGCPGHRSRRQHEKPAPPVPSPRDPRQLRPGSRFPRPSSARRTSSCPSRRRWRTPSRTSSRRRTFHLFRPVRPPTGHFHRAISRLFSNKRDWFHLEHRRDERKYRIYSKNVDAMRSLNVLWKNSVIRTSSLHPDRCCLDFDWRYEKNIHMIEKSPCRYPS